MSAAGKINLNDKCRNGIIRLTLSCEGVIILLKNFQVDHINFQ